jgi:predicted pyridoxine 5'-phosphate oxidase superfamily flavin-nucleotide-binding protein
VTASDAEPLTLDDLQHCFDGAVPVIVATVSGAGVPNVTYLSKCHRVDAERVALSNQFMSKSARNLIEHPRASLNVVDPGTHAEFRLTIVFERTERRGQVFDRLREDVETIAAMTGMSNVFRLRAADIYRVIDIERLNRGHPVDHARLAPSGEHRDAHGAPSLAEVTGRISRCGDLDTLVRVVVDSLDELLGYQRSMPLLVDETGGGLFTIASHGFPTEGVGSEVAFGDGIVGIAAARCAPVRVGSVRQMAKYSRGVRRSFEASGDIGPGHEIPVPGWDDTNSRLAVPAMALGQLVGVLVVESPRWSEYTVHDEATLSVIASLVASSVESIRAEERRAVQSTSAPAARGPAPAPAIPPGPAAASVGGGGAATTHVRFFPVDGSTFLDGDYLIKGVAGRLLWTLLRQHERERRTDFTNREVRLDPTLDLPDFKDNFESRLILLKRRLDERGAPIRIEKTGRGRFRLVVETSVRLEEMASPD